MLDVAATRRDLVRFLSSIGFEPRDADGADFASPSSPVRFKVGTSYGEVAITCWDHRNQQFRAIRITSVRGLHQAKLEINEVLA